jgi:outer membrane protein assembly factor BamB
MCCRSPEGKKRMRGSTGAGVAGVLLSVCFVLPAHALVSRTPDASWQADARVNAIVRSGDRVFIGGRFTSLFDHASGSVTRQHLAVLDAATGEPSALGRLDGEVKALAVSPDGTTLYVGGSFGEANNQLRAGIAAFSIDTGALLPFQADVTGGRVNAIAATSDAVFIGGTFTQVDGNIRRRLAALDPSTGEVTPWYPGLTDGGDVKALSLPTPTRLVVGGSFTRLGDQDEPFIGAVTPVTAQVVPWTAHPRKPVITMASSGGAVYAGTMSNGATRFNPSSGSRVWTRAGDGDVQALAVLEGIVYIGGHFNTFEGIPEPHLAALEASSGAAVDWPARVNSELGVFSMWADGDLYMGGDFTNVTGQDQARIAFMSGA